MKLQPLGIDLAKNVFHLVGLDSSGQMVIRRRSSRTKVLAFTANVKVQVIGMEACSGAHFLRRARREQRHNARPYRELRYSPGLRLLSNKRVTGGFAVLDGPRKAGKTVKGSIVYTRCTYLASQPRTCSNGRFANTRGS